MLESMHVSVVYFLLQAQRVCNKVKYSPSPMRVPGRSPCTSGRIQGSGKTQNRLHWENGIKQQLNKENSNPVTNQSTQHNYMKKVD